MPTPLNSVEVELRDCLTAWIDNPEAKWAWCCHHEVLLEPMRAHFMDRIVFILRHKSSAELPARLRNFRPITTLEGQLVHLEALRAAAQQAFKQIQCHSAQTPPYGNTPVEIQKYTDWRAKYEELHHISVDATFEYHKHKDTMKQDMEALIKAQWPDNTWTGESVFME